MPLTLNVGLSKKVGLPHYGSLGVTCHVQVELDSALLQSDLDAFHDKVKRTYAACHQAVNDELHRQHPGAVAGGQNGNHPAAEDAHSSPVGNAGDNGQVIVRRATSNQVRAILTIGQRLKLDLATWLYEKFGRQAPAELSLGEASTAIDELKRLTSLSKAAHLLGSDA